MAEARSLSRRASAGSEAWKYHAYVGYSMIHKLPEEKKRVMAVLSERRDSRATPMVSTEFTGFVFVEPEKRMSVNAFNSWRRRNNLMDLDLIVHTSKDTAAEGLLSCLRPQNGKESCKYFLPIPSSIARASAVEEISVGSQPPALSQSAVRVSTGVSTPVASDAPTDHHRPWFPPSARHTKFVESLTPLLFGQDDALVSRSQGYEIGSYLGGGSYGAVYQAISPTGEDVAVKILHKDAWGKLPERQRTMREVYVLERCSDLAVHIVRVLDVFLDDKARHMHIVMELWGESLESYRRRQGFDRVDSQPTTHIRTLLLHVCRALSYLHRGLGMCHTDVKLANILIIDKVDRKETGIECKLADVGSVEEVTAILSPSRAGSRYPPYPTGGFKYTPLFSGRGDRLDSYLVIELVVAVCAQF